MSTTTSTLALVKEVFAAFDAHDLDRFRDLLANDAVLNVGGGEESVQGADAIVAAVGVTLQAIPDLRVTVTNVFAEGNRGVAEVVREGTHSVAVDLPGGVQVPPTHQAVRLPECAVFTLRDQKIIRMVVYTDRLDTFQQLGMIPKEGDV